MFQAFNQIQIPLRCLIINEMKNLALALGIPIVIFLTHGWSGSVKCLNSSGTVVESSGS